MKVKLEECLEKFVKLINDKEGEITINESNESQLQVDEKISELQALIIN